MSGQNKVSVRPSNVAGRGLFTTEDITAGDTLLDLPRALTWALDDDRIDDTCDNCCTWITLESDSEDIRVPAGVSACMGCKKVKYCSKVDRPLGSSRIPSSFTSLLSSHEVFLLVFKGSLYDSDARYKPGNHHTNTNVAPSPNDGDPTCLRRRGRPSA